MVDKYGFKEHYFAEGIYEIARMFFDMSNKDRKLLIDIGQKMREINHEVWINHTFKKANQSELSCVSDCRQENEYEAGVMNGYLPIRISCKRDEAVNRIIKRDGHCDVSLLDTIGEIGTRHIPMIVVDNNEPPEKMYTQLDRIVDYDWSEYIKHLQDGIKNDERIRENRKKWEELDGRQI